MIDGIEEKIKAIIAIADSCPEKYNETCFRVLLEYELNTSSCLKSNSNSSASEEVPLDSLDSTSSEIVQREIIDGDLHIKFRQFMKKYDVSIETLNNLFYIEANEILPLYDDLKTIRASEIQIKATLVGALVNAMKTGNFEINGEAIRAECQKRKAYDSGNFPKNFKNSSALFDGFDSYTKGQTLKLSESGKEEASKILGEL